MTETSRDADSAWRDLILHDDDKWDPFAEGARWIFDNIPLTRIFEAFEAGTLRDDAEPVRPADMSYRRSTLFDLCVRFVVDFQYVNDAVQAMLPPAAPAQGPLPSAEKEGVPPFARWVAYGPPYLYDVTPGYLYRISERAAARLALRHVTALIYTRRRTVPCLAPRVVDESPATGLYLWAWEIVMGKHTRGRSLDAPGSKCVFVNLNSPLSWHASHVRIANDQDDSGCWGERVPHPWGERFHVYAGEEGAVAGWVHGDGAFFINA